MEGRLKASSLADAQRLTHAIRQAVAGDLLGDAAEDTMTQDAIHLGDAALGEALIATAVPLRNSAPQASAVVFV